MLKRNKLHSAALWFRSDLSLLIFVWLAGLLLGTMAIWLDPFFFSWMRPQLSDRVSIVSSIVAAVFPFLLAALAVHINCKVLLLILAFLKTFSFAFCGFLIFHAYGSAGWLLRFLLMFTDICILPIFCWYCIRSIEKNRVKDFTVCVFFALAVACFDCFVVSPFLAKLIMI